MVLCVLLVLHVLELGHRERVEKVYLVNSINYSCLLDRLGEREDEGLATDLRIRSSTLE